MLFLAVFCGFLAENQREHYVEHKREKQFIRSLVDDLGRDTSKINRWLTILNYDQNKIDSAIHQYSIKKKLTGFEIAQIGKMGFSGTWSINVVFTERTSSQLKNSGGMRLIRNKKVSDLTTDYWNEIDQYKFTHTRLENYRIDTRKLGFKIFGDLPGIYLRQFVDSSFLIDSSGILNNSPLLLGEYVNNLTIIGNVYHTQYYPQLNKLLNLAKSLIILIKKEYHLK
jgi:hypothetical protein